MYVYTPIHSHAHANKTKYITTDKKQNILLPIGVRGQKTEREDNKNRVRGQTNRVRGQKNRVSGGGDKKTV